MDKHQRGSYTSESDKEMGIRTGVPRSREGGLVTLHKESEKVSGNVTLEGEEFVTGRTFQAQFTANAEALRWNSKETWGQKSNEGDGPLQAPELFSEMESNRRSE